MCSKTQSRAHELDLHSMVENNTARCSVILRSVDSKKVKGGISACDRSLTIQAISSLKTKPDDLVRPGYIFL